MMRSTISSTSVEKFEMKAAWITPDTPDEYGYQCLSGIKNEEVWTFNFGAPSLAVYSTTAASKWPSGYFFAKNTSRPPSFNTAK